MAAILAIVNFYCKECKSQVRFIKRRHVYQCGNISDSWSCQNGHTAGYHIETLENLANKPENAR